MKQAKEVEANEVWNVEHSCIRVKGWEGGRGSWSEDAPARPSLSLYGEYQMAILYSYPEVWLLVNSQNGLNEKTLNCNKGPHIEWSSDQTQLWKQEMSGAWSLLVNSEERLKAAQFHSSNTGSLFRNYLRPINLSNCNRKIFWCHHVETFARNTGFEN